MDAEEQAKARELCLRTIARLPTILEFEEWSRRFDAIETDEQLGDVLIRLAQLTETYKQRGIDVIHSEPWPYLKRSNGL